MSLGTYRRAAAALAALGMFSGMAAGPAYADGSGGHSAPIGIAAAGDCSFPSKPVQGTPWSLQRVLLDQLWQTGSGAGVKVAVIDTGVDNTNPQLSAPGKVTAGPSYLTDKNNGGKTVDGTSYDDTVGHGTKVAGIIAATPLDKKVTGFAGLAKDALILAYRQNDAQGDGDVSSLAKAINQAVSDGAKVINISQDVRGSDSDPNFRVPADLEAAVKNAISHGVVVVASSGNDGQEGPTYPAALPGVIAVGASDRNNERAPFSQYGDFVSLVAPGVDMLSTVPKGGHCIDNGTSFSAPYVAGVAAIVKGLQPNWTSDQVGALLEQTAQRTQRTRNKFTGWGVIDPLKAAQAAASYPKNDTSAPTQAHDDPKVALDTAKIVAQPLGLAETEADREARTATFVLGIAALLVAAFAGGAIVVRDYHRRQAV